MWWPTPVSLTLGMQRWEDQDFEVILSYLARLRPDWHTKIQNPLKQKAIVSNGSYLFICMPKTDQVLSFSVLSVLEFTAPGQ